MADLKIKLLETYNNWKKDEDQIDDVLIIGIEI